MEQELYDIIKKAFETTSDDSVLIPMGSISLAYDCKNTRARNIRDKEIAEHDFLTNQNGKLLVYRKGFYEWLEFIKQEQEHSMELLKQERLRELKEREQIEAESLKQEQYRKQKAEQEQKLNDFLEVLKEQDKAWLDRNVYCFTHYAARKTGLVNLENYKKSVVEKVKQSFQDQLPDCDIKRVVDYFFSDY